VATLASNEVSRLPRPLVLALALVVLLGLTGFTVGPTHDDLIHRMVIEGRLADYPTSPANVYDFVDNDYLPAFVARGYAPWWSDPELELRFLRPLASALLVFDFEVLGGSPALVHLHSLAWLLGLVALTWACLRRLLPAREAGLATVLYAVAGAHTFTAGWAAARYPLVAGVFGFGALLLHLCAARGELGERWRPWHARALALVALAAALAAGEIALGAAAMVVAYELLGRRERPVVERLTAALPPLALTAAYLAVYSALGYGVRGSGMYVDPRAEPLRYLEGAFSLRLPMLAGDAFTNVPADLAFALVGSERWLARWGILVLVIAAVAWLVLRRRVAKDIPATLAWLGAGAFAGLLPALAGVAGGRMLVFALAFSASFVAALVVAAWAAARAAAGRRKLAWYHALAPVALAHGGLGPLIRLASPPEIARQGREEWRIGVEAELCEGTVLLVAAADPAVGIYGPASRLILQMPGPDHFHVLSMAPQDHRIEQVHDRGFDVVVLGERKRNDWERVQRAAPWRVGERAELPAASVEVVETSALGPQRLRITTREPLKTGRLCLATWRDGGIRRLTMPMPASVVDLPHELGPMNL
jgi:hypothetical protein